MPAANEKIIRLPMPMDVKRNSVVFFLVCALACAPPAAAGSDISDAEYYYLQGKRFIMEGDYKRANESFKKAQSVLGEIAGESAADTGEKAENVPEKRFVWEKAKIMYERGDISGAAELYSQALKLYPRNYDLRYNLGVAYLKMKEYSKAAKEFKTVVARNSNDREAHYNLGIIYENYLNNKEKAVYYYKNYLKYAVDEEEKDKVRLWVKELQRWE